MIEVKGKCIFPRCTPKVCTIYTIALYNIFITVYVDYFTRIIFRFINVHVTLISRIIHVYGIHMYSGKDLVAFNFTKTCHREIKVTLKLSVFIRVIPVCSH